MKIKVTVDDRLNEMRPRHCEPPNGAQIVANVGGRTHVAVLIHPDGSGHVYVHRNGKTLAIQDWKYDVQGMNDQLSQSIEHMTLKDSV